MIGMRLHKDKYGFWKLTDELAQLPGCRCCYGEMTIDDSSPLWDEWMKKFQTKFNMSRDDLEGAMDSLMEYYSKDVV